MRVVPERADEPCPFCLQRHELWMEVRCADCDSPLCPFCVVRIRERRVTICPACHHVASH